MATEATEQELRAAMKLALERGDKKTARAIAERIVTGEEPQETAFSEAARRRSEVEGSVADRERMRPDRQGITEFGTPEDFAAGAARTAEFFAKLPGYVMQRQPMDEDAGPLERQFRMDERPLLADEAAEVLSPESVEKGFDALGINREGGEDSFMGRSGEFVAGGLLGGMGNIIRTAKAAGFNPPISSLPKGPYGAAGALARNVGSSELAAVGSEMGGNWAERNGLHPIIGELSGALAPSVLVRSFNRAITGASQADRTVHSKMAKDAIEDAKSLDVALSGGTASPNSRVSFFERVLASIPGGTRPLHDFAIKTSHQIENSLKRITTPMRGDIGTETAGIGITTALNRRINNFKKAAERLYDNARAIIPAEQPIQVTRFRGALDEIVGGTPEKVKDLVASIRAGRKQIAPKVAKALDKIEDGQTLTFEEADAVRRVIGHEINNSSLIGDAPVGELKKLYGAISNDIAAGLTTDVQKAAWKGANNFWKQGRQEVDDFYAPLLKNNSKPEQVFDALFASGGAKISTIRKVWKTMNPKERELASKAFIAKLGKITQGEDGSTAPSPMFKMGTFITNWNKPEFQAAKNLMLRGQPKLRRDMEVFVNHIARVLDNNASLYNSSGTAASGLAAATAYYALAGLAGAGIGATFGEEGNKDVAATTLGVGGLLVASKAARSAAILMTNPSFVNWLARGTRVPVNKTAEYLGQLAAIAQREEPYVAEAIADFTNEYSSMLDPGLLEATDFQGRPITQ